MVAVKAVLILRLFDSAVVAICMVERIDAIDKTQNKRLDHLISYM